ncbi:alpha/beta fold hydrolase [Glycomyces sp. NEAU-S30]|uniref:Alpha/beta fold hydrolase n=1 Tax=Glycomyces niveus TaxID=2820287 RepID=A0ABS3U710_9ACTN|nr:alpha/beta fold hydrolase [Glycomyces sp. NEAU-S30]
MRSINRFLIAAGTAAVCVLALVPAAAFAGGGGGRGSIDWRPCEGAPEFDCATVEVPLDYERPRGEKIEIALARRPATNPEERIGSILMDPGGPGGSGVQDVINGEYALAEDAAERFDLIGFDPRGVGGSTPIDCSAELVAAFETHPVPTTEAGFEEHLALSEATAESCRELTGPLFDHADNLHVVEDIERIRRAIGEGDLNYLGFSYGTLMGQQYAEAYPQHVRTMVLDGNQDHSQETMWEFISADTAGFERNFTEFAQWCDATEDCALHGAGTIAVYKDLQERARAGELTDPQSGAPLDFFGLTRFAFAANQPRAWTQLAAGLQAMREGTSVSTESHKAVTEAAAVRQFPEMAMFCQDWDFRIEEFDEWDAMMDRLAEEHPVTEWSPYAGLPLMCSGSGIEATNPQAPLDIEGAPPIVLVGTVHDYATVYPWSESVAEQTGAALVTYEGWGHTVYGLKSTCVDEAVDAYFIDREVPAAGLSCPSVD